MLSEELFEHRIASLKLDLLKYGSDIMDHISVLYAGNETTNGIDLKNDPINMLKILRQDVAEVLQQSQVEVNNNFENRLEIDECSRLSKALSKVSFIAEKLVECEQEVNNYNLEVSCQLIKCIELALLEIPLLNTEIRTGKVYAILHRESKILKSRFTSKLRRLLNESIKFECGRIHVANKLKGMLRSEDEILEDSIKLSDIWKALVSIDRIDDVLEKVLKSFWMLIIHPLWKEKKPQSPVIDRDENRSELLFENIARNQQGKVNNDDDRINNSSFNYFDNATGLQFYNFSQLYYYY
jgi:hypothetical protein